LINEDERNQHREFIKNTPSAPLFITDWWLDAVCENNWGAATLEYNNEVSATLPYYLINRNGFKIITMPKLTQSMGPWIKYPERNKEPIFRELIRILPPHAMFSQTLHYTIDNWFPFYWNGFKETTRYTYVLHDINKVDSLRNELRRDIKRELRDAEKKGIIIEESDDTDQLYKICSLSFKRQNLETPFSLELLKRIDSEASRRKCRKILFAKDPQGEIHAAEYIVWDQTTAHNILTGTDPKYKNSGATSLILWESLKRTIETGKSFNFEGSMIESIEEFYRAFNGDLKRYFHITKTNSKILRLLIALRNLTK
jgi:lipid II:glycine glycyltransferase (peptidoglycan interpeptide bridge formation enzyme)